MKKGRAKKRAFTLIELLVVVAIVGILASVIFAKLSDAREKGKIARAKVEVDQIKKAAELVFSDYGYYPNDSHGSIICPKDIIVDLGTNKTWSSYINICNDPWGNPYEWNNQCGSAGTRQPHAPFDPSCASYSEVDPGPIGVTVVGSDGINNGCTGDDICSGNRGHTTYGYDGQIISAVPMCLNTISNCSGLSAIGCLARTGCSLGSSGCSGSYNNTCTGFNQASCTPSGCSWSMGGCGGSPSACSTYGTSGSCGVVTGCSWAPSACTGTVNCATYTGGSQNACINRGCSFNPVGSVCSGAPSCTGFSLAQCPGASGCITAPASCGGSPSACSTYGTSGSCGVVTGCSWSGSPSCQGTYTDTCNNFSDQTSCQTQASCSWGSGTCTGSAVSCTTFSDQNSCTLQSGCSWQ